jgi:hypothetical protein
MTGPHIDDVVAAALAGTPRARTIPLSPDFNLTGADTIDTAAAAAATVMPATPPPSGVCQAPDPMQ